MRVLLALEHGAGPMTLTQIAEGCGMQASKVHRYLVSLGRVGARVPVTTVWAIRPRPVDAAARAEAVRRMDEVGLASEYLPFPH